MATMKAARIHDYGGPDVFRYEDAERPVPQDDEVLVRVHAIGVNPVDWRIREGQTKSFFPLSMPGIVGGDISGVIEQTGKAVTGFKVGDAVYAMIGLIGAYAQYVAVKAAFVAPKPATLDHKQAASVPLASLTAWQALFDTGGLAAGQKLLVQAAAGGVGGFAVQLGRWKGARVTGTASSGNAVYVRELGAEEVIDYNAGPLRAGQNYDAGLSLVSGPSGEQTVSVLKPGGVLLAVVPASPQAMERATAANVRVAPVRVKPSGAQLREIGALIDAGKLRTTIAGVFPLEQAGKAHQQSQTGHTRGKLVLTAI